MTDFFGPNWNSKYSSASGTSASSRATSFTESTPWLRKRIPSITAREKLLLSLGLLLLFWCEFLLPKVYSADWAYDDSACTGSVPCTRVLLLSDPQLQGYRDEPWGPLGYLTRWDADRFLGRAFSAAVEKLTPDVIVILGDILDEGFTQTKSEAASSLWRFNHLFQTAIPTIILAGDNDIGGEGGDVLSDRSIGDFEQVFGSVNAATTAAGLTFLRVNTLGLQNKSMQTNPFHITLQTKSFITSYTTLREAARSNGTALASLILLSHIPLDFLVHADRKWLLESLHPAAVLSGHTHAFATYEHASTHGQTIPEITAPTLSYRMGTSNIGFVALAVAAGSSPRLAPRLCRVAPRYPSLALYAAYASLCLLAVYGPAIAARVGCGRRRQRRLSAVTPC